jgi:hypothetical protein
VVLYGGHHAQTQAQKYHQKPEKFFLKFFFMDAIKNLKN